MSWDLSSFCVGFLTASSLSALASFLFLRWLKLKSSIQDAAFDEKWRSEMRRMRERHRHQPPTG